MDDFEEWFKNNFPDGVPLSSDSFLTSLDNPFESPLPLSTPGMTTEVSQPGFSSGQRSFENPPSLPNTSLSATKVLGQAAYISGPLLSHACPPTASTFPSLSVAEVFNTAYLSGPSPQARPAVADIVPPIVGPTPFPDTQQRGRKRPRSHGMPVPVPGLTKKIRGRRIPLSDDPSRRKWECPVEDCKRPFVRQEHLKRHINSIHTNKKFMCPVEGCGKLFSRMDNLKMHKRSHDNADDSDQLLLAELIRTAPLI